MDSSNYRLSGREVLRSDDLMRLVPDSGIHVLDVGARDGHFSTLLADRFHQVTALDLETPKISSPRVTCVQGDVTQLQFADNTFDLVFCTEVLEHIRPEQLGVACRELARVSNDRLLIGVPYKQDIRVGRTTCQSCHKANPPWGHLSIFDEQTLRSQFHEMSVETVSFVGENVQRTNAVSTFLMDLAGNPYGTYDQDEPCIHCGAAITPPKDKRPLYNRALSRAAFTARRITESTTHPIPSWIHMVFRKEPVAREQELIAREPVSDLML